MASLTSVQRDAALVAHGLAARVALAAVSALLALCVFIIFLRRAAGALDQPLSPVTLTATGLVAMFAASLVRAAWLSQRSKNWAILWTPATLVLLLMLALWVPGTSVAGVVLLVATVALDACVAAALQAGWGKAILQRRFSRSHPRIDLPRTPRFSADMLQHLTRRRMPDGGELIEGEVRVLLSARQRIEHCHLAFCPPLNGTPQVTCRQIEGVPARLKVAQVLPQGARIEVRLEQPAAEDTSLVIAISVRAIKQARQDAQDQTG